MLVYLDQNYASRIAKFLLGQPSHDSHGLLYQALLASKATVPPSPFHVLEALYPARERDVNKRGYLLPALQRVFDQLSQGYWVRPWQEVLKRQLASGGRVLREDFLSRKGDWQTPADLERLKGITEVGLEGDFLQRTWKMQGILVEWLGLPERGERLPLVQVLARLLAFRSGEAYRQHAHSDLNDLVMTATVRPYVDILATDRYFMEALKRVGYGGGVYGGRKREVLRLVDDLTSLELPRSESGD